MNKDKNKKTGTTTIKLATETKERLDKLKEFKKETYDELIQKILEILNYCIEEPERAKKILILISARSKKIQKKIKKKVSNFF